MIQRVAKATVLFVAFIGFCCAVVLDYVKNGTKNTHDYTNE
jgi:hypothetical protein